MKIRETKIIKTQLRVTDTCCFCQDPIAQGSEAIKFVERVDERTAKVDFACLYCWRELRRSVH